jgi:hypothetical protein
VGEQLSFFEQVADRQMTAPAKAKQRAIDKRRDRGPPPLSAQERKLHNQAKQARVYRAYRRRQLKEQYSGKHKQGWHDLRKTLRQASIDNPENIIDHIAKAKWIHGADLDTRHLVLSIISSKIVRLRERNGLDPFDDALPGEPDTVFQIVRSMIMKRPEPGADSASVVSTGVANAKANKVTAGKTARLTTCPKAI